MSVNYQFNFQPSPIKKDIETDGNEATDVDVYYEPVVTLPVVPVVTNEEDEVELCKMRAKLFRFDKVEHEWRECGVGDVKLLHHKERGTVRIVMRRDKTHKICANHFVTPQQKLNPHIGSDRAFNWTTFGDFADETPKMQLLAIKFGSVENANMWKTKFLEAQEIVHTDCNLYNGKDSDESLENSFSEKSDASESEASLSGEADNSVKEKVPEEETEKSNDENLSSKLSELAVNNKDNPVNETKE